MPPRLAAVLTWGFVLWLFRRDFRQKPNVTGAIWIPTIWVLILTTRAVTTWLGMFGFSLGGASLEEGSTLDAMVYFALIAAGIRILAQRQVQLMEVIRANRWLTFYLFYCFLAVMWSDFPFVSLKRWAKDLGHPVMVLIIYTEPDFKEAFTLLFKRVAYVVLPVSILFIKYYPEWGRGFSFWTGAAYNTGITDGKNALGYDLLILGFFFAWHLLMTLGRKKSKPRRDEILLCIGFFYMIWWLFSVADSKTPLVSLFLGLAILLLASCRWINKRFIGGYLLIGGLTLVAADQTFGLYKNVIELLGRDTSLTERTPLWEELGRWGRLNPVFGTGFESFWLGDRREKIWDTMEWQASEAHNGYLETYLDLGTVGLALLICLIAVAYWKGRMALLQDSGFGRFRFAFLFAILMYNWTESSFGGLHPVFFVFHFVAMDFPTPKLQPVPQFSAILGAESQEEALHATGVEAAMGREHGSA